jgi:hypothetical protein
MQNLSLPWCWALAEREPPGFQGTTRLLLQSSLNAHGTWILAEMNLLQIPDKQSEGWGWHNSNHGESAGSVWPHFLIAKAKYK